MLQKSTISVDVGGTNILSALVNKKGKIIERIKISTNVEAGTGVIVSRITESIHELLSKKRLTFQDIENIVVGVPGTVNPFTGLVGVAPNLKLENFNFKKALERKLNFPILIENDVNLAALGIKKFELKNKARNMLVLFIGTGIGGALIFDGKIYRGSSFIAGEIGYMKIVTDGYLSVTKKVLTFEDVASRTAIVKMIKKDLKKHPEVKSVLRNVKKIKSKVLAEAIASRDPLAVKHITNASKVIGRVLASATSLLNVDTIALGGGVLEAMGDFMLPIIEKAFYKNVLKEAGEGLKIFVTKLGDDAPIYGGLALAEEHSKGN